MPSASYVGCFTFSDLTVASASGYTGYIGSRERIIPMNGNESNESIAAVERVATGLHQTLPAEFQSPMGGAEMRCEWNGEDFNRIILTTPEGGVELIVTSVVGEAPADVRVVVFDLGDRGDDEAFECGAYVREMMRVARAVDAIPGVDGVWPDVAWPKAFFASVNPEKVDS